MYVSGKTYLVRVDRSNPYRAGIPRRHRSNTCILREGPASLLHGGNALHVLHSQKNMCVHYRLYCAICCEQFATRSFSLSVSLSRVFHTCKEPPSSAFDFPSAVAAKVLVCCPCAPPTVSLIRLRALSMHLFKGLVSLSKQCQSYPGWKEEMEADKHM